FNEEEAAQLFAGFRERAIRHEPASVADTNARRGRNRLQGGCAQVLASLVEFMGQCGGLRNAVLALALGPGLFVAVDKQHVLHGFLLGNWFGNCRICPVVVREVRKSTSGRDFFTLVPEGVFAGNGVRAPVWLTPRPVRKTRVPRWFFLAGGTDRRGPRG